MESPELIPPQEETTKRFAQVRKLFIGLLTTWKTTLLLIFVVSYCWHERFWRDPVMRFTCPLLLFALSLPILGYYNFSFTQLFRKRKESLRP
jgi:predicted metal-binding membrane protein